MQRLDLRRGHDHLDVGDPPDEARDRRARVAAPGLEVRADARPQRLRLADVEHVALRVAKEVDARLRRDSLQFVRDVRHSGYLSHAVIRLLAALHRPARVRACGARGRDFDRLRRRRGPRPQSQRGRVRGRDGAAPPRRLQGRPDHELLDSRAVRADAARGDGPRERRHRCGDPRRPCLRLGLQRGLAHDATDGEGAKGVRELRGRDRPRQPGLPRRDHRQRAEPEPLLAAAVRCADAERRLGAGVSSGSSPAPTTR